MKDKWQIIGLSAALSLSAFANGEVEVENEGKGAHGGRITSSGVLNDFVTSAKCDRWVEGSRYRKVNSKLKKILRNLEKVHWLSASNLKREIDRLEICETGKLKKVPVTKSCEGNIPVTSYVSGTKQAAIRIESNVYLDKAFYDQQSEETQAYLMIHEASHSFFKTCSNMRSMNLHSFVNSVKKVNDGVIRGTSEYEYQLEKNKVYFAGGQEKLSDYKEIILFSEKEYPGKRRDILESRQLYFLRDRVPTRESLENMRRYLCKVRDGEFNARDNKNCSEKISKIEKGLTTFVAEACGNNDTDVVDKILASQKPNLMIAKECMINSLKNADQVFDQVRDSEFFSSSVKEVVDGMRLRNIELQNYRLVFNPYYENFAKGMDGLEVADESRIVRIDGLGVGDIFSSVVILTVEGSKKSYLKIDELLFNNNAFYEIFGVHDLLSSVDLLGYFEKDKELAREGIVRFHQSVMDTFLTKLKEVHKNNPFPYLDFVKKIDFEKLGLENRGE